MSWNKTKSARWSATALLAGLWAWVLTPAALAQGFGGSTAAGAATGMSGLSGGAGGLGGGMTGMAGGMSGMSGGSAFSNTGSMAGGGGFSGNGLGITGGMSGLGMSGYGMAGMSGYGVSPTNLLATYYVNPLSLGLNVQTGVATTPVGAFGLPTFGTAAMGMMGSSMSGGMSGSMLGTMAGGMSGLGSGMRGMGTGTGTATQPPFTMVLEAPAGGLSTSSTPPQTFAPRNAALEQTVLNVLASSSALPSKQGILVAVAGETVILRGTVSDMHQKRLAEALLRLTPGVRNVQNEIQVR